MSLHASLDEFFAGAAGKYLTAVEANPVMSNQHEFNGVTSLKELLGEPPDGGLTLPTRFIFLDDEMEAETTVSRLTWYDARAKHPTRSECRLYYPSNLVMDGAAEGDYMVVAPLARGVDAEAQAVVIISPAGASVTVQLQVLFGLEPSDRLDIEPIPDDREMSFTSRQLIEALGYDVTRVQEDALGEMLERFGPQFPSSAHFSALARETSAGADPLRDPDSALLLWMDHEEALYRTLEHHLLIDRFALAESVEETLEIAMQTFQRRRARAGKALENHVAEILSHYGVPFDSQARTEGRKQPDFLFPGSNAYHDPSYPSDRLMMLGVKTTCKDRWRQVLTEADRVAHKHLLTLEAPISVAQTSEMDVRSLSLVVPLNLHDLFETAQRPRLLSLQTFLTLLPHS